MFEVDGVIAANAKKVQKWTLPTISTNANYLDVIMQERAYTPE